MPSGKRRGAGRVYQPRRPDGGPVAGGHEAGGAAGPVSYTHLDVYKRQVLDMPYIINKQYSYAEGYVTEQSHGADANGVASLAINLRPGDYILTAYIL